MFKMNHTGLIESIVGEREESKEILDFSLNSWWMEIPLTAMGKAIGADTGVGEAQVLGFGYSKLLMLIKHPSGRVD